MPLFFTNTPKAKKHNPQSHQKAKEAGFQAVSYQQTQTEGDQRTAAKLIPSAHKNTPCTNLMQGVFQILIAFIQPPYTRPKHRRESAGRYCCRTQRLG